jgi:hypothetical protein
MVGIETMVDLIVFQKVVGPNLTVTTKIRIQENQCQICQYNCLKLGTEPTVESSHFVRYREGTSAVHNVQLNIRTMDQLLSQNLQRIAFLFGRS